MMQQTPMHEQHNPDLLRMIPQTARRVIEVGCSSGALAREFRLRVPDVHWVGVDIDPAFTQAATRHCDRVLTLDIDGCDDAFFAEHADRDCWIFGDTLEHLKNPWAVLSGIRRVIPPTGHVVACIPNAQHWSLIARLALGDFTYQDSGLMDRTHLRWFTRTTILKLFQDQGFQVTQGFPRVFQEKDRARVLPHLLALSAALGADPRQVERDASALQYVIQAVPV